MTESVETESETPAKSAGGSFISPTFLLILLLFVLLGWGGMALYESLFERVVNGEHGDAAAIITLESTVGSVAGRVEAQQRVNDAQDRYLSLRVGADLYSSRALMEYLAADPGTAPAARQRAARIATELEALRNDLAPITFSGEKRQEEPQMATPPASSAVTPEQLPEADASEGEISGEAAVTGEVTEEQTPALAAEGAETPNAPSPPATDAVDPAPPAPAEE